MRFAAAILFALAVVVAQVAHSGLKIPFLAYPAYALAAFGAICALSTLRGSTRSPWFLATVAMIALSAYALWRCAVAPDQSLAMVDAGIILGCVTMWAGVAIGLTRNDARFLFVTICLLGGCVQVIFAVMQLVQQAEFSLPYWFSQQLMEVYAHRFPYRPRGLFLNPNQFAWLMNVLALLALSLGIWGRVRVVTRIMLLYLAAVFAVMTVLSASRGGMVSLMVAFCAFLALSLVAVFQAVGSRRFLLLGVGCVLLVSCVGAVYAAFSTSWMAQSRLDSLLKADVRGGFTEQAIRLFQTDPVLGVGPGIYRYAARLYRTGDVPGDPVYAHNDWLQFLAEYGVVGLAILVLVVVLALIAGARGFLTLVQVASKESGSPMSSSGAFVLGACCALVAGAVHGNVDFNMHVPANALLIAALLGLVTGARPFGFKPQVSRAWRGTWLAAFAALLATGGLAVLIVQRGPADYYSLQAGNFLARADVKGALETTERGLRSFPDDPTLLAQRGQALYEYESWLQANTPAEKVEKARENTFEAEPSEESEESDDSFVEEPVVLLSDAEREKFFQDSAAAFAHAAKRQPLNRAHYIAWARALVELGDDADARSKYIEAIRLDPFLAHVWASYGDFLLERDKVSAARRIYETGAYLPGGDYARGQVESIDEDLATEAEEQQGSK